MTKISHLPKRLTISFTLWSLYDTKGGIYTDIDKMMREHIERGFNCIRIDCGAGLVHNADGTPIGPVNIGRPFGKYSKAIRQNDCMGEGGKCDLLERLIKMCESAKAHGVYLILSSWYYLHTFWILHDEHINKKLFEVPPHERFMLFANFMHYILCELEKRGLDDTIAFVEIFNEANELPFITSYGRKKISNKEVMMFTKEHKEAIAWLKKEHPNILIAFDCCWAWCDEDRIPENMDVFNFHNYHLWSLYDCLDNPQVKGEFFRNSITEEDIRRSREGRFPAADDWNERVAKYNNINRARIIDIEEYLENELIERYDFHIEKFDKAFSKTKKLALKYSGIPFVCGEGVTYCASKALLWEEKSDNFWKVIEHAMKEYKKAGVWGTVIKTCLGPEDPSWNMCADRIRSLNKMFLE